MCYCLKLNLGSFCHLMMPPTPKLEAGSISERTKAALAAAKARGVKLGNPNGARALRGKQVGNKEAPIDSSHGLCTAEAKRTASGKLVCAETLRPNGHPCSGGTFPIASMPQLPHCRVLLLKCCWASGPSVVEHQPQDGSIGDEDVVFPPGLIPDRAERRHRGMGAAQDPQYAAKIHGYKQACDAFVNAMRGNY